MSEPSSNSYVRPLVLTEDASAWLDMCRGLAAVAVLVGHWRAILFVEFGQVEQPRWWMAPFYFVTGLGHQAVIVFFVLSGFFIGNVVMDSARLGRWSTARYAIDRFSRLYVVLIPALFVGWIWDRVGIELFGVLGIYGGQVSNEHVVTFSVADRNGLGVLVGNLAFLQTIVVPPFGSNGPLWSLAYEFWYYVIFPMLFFAISARAGWQRWGLVVAALVALAAVGDAIATYFGIWLLGVLTSWIARRASYLERSRSFPTVLLVLVLLIGALALSKSNRLRSEFVADVVVGLSFALVVWVILGARLHPLWRKLGRWLSRISYTLYLVHLPPLVFWAAARGGDYKVQPTFNNVGWLLPGLVLLFAWAVVFYLLTERHTHRVRRFLLRKFNLPLDRTTP